MGRGKEMTIMILETASLSLRGQLCKWMLETKPGVFIGKISALVREHLWKMVQEDAETSSALLIYNAPTELGFEIQMLGEPTRSVIEFDGLQLIKYQ